ncbi:MAG: stage III sporulation protein AF [Firmicutes bacterium]|nr:stage III sporulation protein AF [Bacillota bacterium]
MWSWVGEWLRGLLVVVLLGNLAEWLLPRSDLRRYAGLVVGLFMLWVMVEPLVAGWQKLEQLKVNPLLPALNPSALSTDTLVAREQTQEVEAFMKTLPGVSACSVTRSGSRFRVAVTLSKPLPSNQLTEFAQLAVAVATGGASQDVQVVVTNLAPGAKGSS